MHINFIKVNSHDGKHVSVHSFVCVINSFKVCTLLSDKPLFRALIDVLLKSGLSLKRASVKIFLLNDALIF